MTKEEIIDAIQSDGELKRYVFEHLAGDFQKRSNEDCARILESHAFELNKPVTFEKGMLVKWKKGLQNKTAPSYDEPAVVIDVFDKPVFDNTSDAASPYYREPLDLQLGVLVKGDFIIYHYDKRKFEPYYPEQ